MNKIFLKGINIKDFKGIKKLSIEFGEVTRIKGNNGLGKTSIFDAFTWLLFDKDSKNRATFDIKPLDQDNKVIRGLVPTVTGTFEVNGQTITFTKYYKEEWTKKRGEEKETFTGNKTLYEVNNVPLKKKEYLEEVGKMVNEEQFKLLSNPYYFSSNLNWKDARKVIIEVAGDVSVAEIIQAEPRLKEMEQDFLSQDIDMVLKSKKATSTKLAKEKKEIPIRLNEIKNSYVDLDFDKLEQEKMQLEKELEDTNLKIQRELDKINNSSNNNEEINNQIKELEIKRDNINSKARQTYYEEKNKLESKLHEINNKISTLEKDNQYDKNWLIEVGLRMKKLQEDKESLSDKYKIIQAKKATLEEIEKECPTCKRPFEQQYIEEMSQQIIENFNIQKAKALEDIKQEGLNKKEQLLKNNTEFKETNNKIDIYDKEIQELSISAKELRKELEILPGKLFITAEDKSTIDSIGKSITDLQENMIAATGHHPTNSLDSLNRMKDIILNKISDIKTQIAQKDINKQLDNRIEDLLLTEKNLGCKIAQFEKQVMLCELFIRTRVNLLESSINAKFKNVSFKMFKEQINGALDETCEALINGVPFSMANTASQINAGLDIINTLSKFYGTSVPVFIDNAEAINCILKVDSQVVKLLVSLDNKIIVEAE